MSEQGYNHYATQVDIDTSILTGKEILMLCGERFAPEIRVGSSGKADDPGLAICPRCEQLYDIIGRRKELKDERDRLAREMRELRAEWSAEREREPECV